MKVNDIILEYLAPEDETNLSANLVSVLMFLKQRSEDHGLVPKLKTDSLIQLVQNAGDNTFDYQALVSAYESDPAIKNLIKSFNENDIILTSDNDADTEEQAVQAQSQAQNPENTVDSMAKSALKRRT